MKPLTISSGGTEATTAQGARTNLDVYSKAETDAAIETAGNEDLSLLYSIEIKEGEVIESFLFEFGEYLKEYQVFAYFPKGEKEHRLIVNSGGCVLYVPKAVSTDEDRYVWIKYEGKNNSFPLSGMAAGIEAYHSNAQTLGRFIKPWQKAKVMSFNTLSGGYPVGTTIKVYGR